MDSRGWDRRYDGDELVWTSQANRFLIEEAAGLPAGRALDVACGEGRNAVWLAERGWQVTGVDFSSVGVAKARALARGRDVNARWLVADLLDFEPDAEAFELVIVFYLQVPAAQRRSILRAVAAAVAPGGLLLVVAHDSVNLARGYGGPQDPAVLYGSSDVAEDLSGTGLRIERAEIVERPVDTPEGTRIALDALLRARRDRTRTEAP
jgi:2-polyprenyl-3-methyl-5-hydroxy-6-metoxy-1,4-benzoquinol methylase